MSTLELNHRLNHVLFINRSYWPDTEATGQLLTDLCEDLAATGKWDVHVLAGMPNHISMTDKLDSAATTSGTIVHNGVTIHRATHTQFSKRSLLGKLTNLLSFTLSAAWAARRVPRPDIVVTETDPFFLALLGKRLQRKRRCQFVAYLQDIYPDVAVAVGATREGVIARIVRGLIFGAYRVADRVVVLSRDMQLRCEKHGVRAERIRVIPNWADVDAVRPVTGPNEFRQAQGVDDKFVVMYSGNQGLPHLLAPILDAAEQLRSRPEIVFLFVGDGVQKQPLEAAAQSRGLTNVRFLPYQPREFLSQSLGAADVHLISVKPDVINCLMPSKLYGILAVGGPIIALAPEGCELSEIVRKNGLGEVCDCEARPDEIVRSLVAAVNRMADDPVARQRMSATARKLAESEYHRPVLTSRFGEMLAELADRTSTAVQSG